jgi:tRNA (guanosine-2'-O-)-methyltransferase
LWSEEPGLSQCGSDLAGHHVTIVRVAMFESFNVWVAAGIVLAEALRQQKSVYDKRRISMAQYRRLFFEWGHPSVWRFCQ